MSVSKRIAAAFVALAASVSAVVSVATPAQAWSYCNDATYYPYSLNLYDLQGYCGPGVWYYTDNGTTNCRTLFGSTANNNAAAVFNTANRGVTLYNDNNCTTANGHYYLPAHNSHPNLYASNIDLGNKITSFRFN